MPGKKTAEWWRQYRERRKTAGNALSGKPAEYYQRYRRRRRLSGHPVAARSITEREFVAWDGEGYTEGEQRPGLLLAEYRAALRERTATLVSEGMKARAARTAAALGLTRATPAPHSYVMLANSRDDVYEDEAGIGTAAAFDALLRGAKAHPGATHVWYGSGYDATMILLGLSRMGKGVLPSRPEATGRDAVAYIVQNKTQRPVHVLLDGKRYAVHYRARKHLRVARFRNAAKPFIRDGAKNRPDYEASICLWDVLGFFQQTFVDALKSYKIEADIEAIAAMKKLRGTFNARDRKKIRAYCVDECKKLELLAATLWKNFLDAGIHPARLDGAGAAAAALLRREGVKEHIVREPDHLALAVAMAYFGGRIELLRLGRCHGPIYVYDLSSAYPAAALLLPTLHGEWVRGTEGFALCRVRWELPPGLPFYPLPYRNPTGTIIFPSCGEGWYWKPEVDAARAFAAHLGGTVEVLDGWQLVPASDVRPFAFVERLYEQRARWKQEKNGAEKALKTALASLYGKTAQQVGGGENGPPYFALPWAGFITSHCRAKLCTAALTDPQAVVAFATDGLYVTRALPVACVPPAPHLQEALGEDAFPPLGGWEGPKVAHDAVFVQAGVYWLYDGESWEAKYRGFDRERMETPEHVLAAWQARRTSIDIPTTRFVTYGSALASDDLWEWRGTWRTAPRKLDLTGDGPKRRGFAGATWPCDGLVRLAVKPNVVYEAGGDLSKPYNRVKRRTETTDGVPSGIYNAEAMESSL